MNVPGMPNINYSVDAIISAVDNTIPLVQEFLKDRSFDLEDRWALYLKIEKLLPVESYLGKAINVLGHPSDIFPDGRGCRYNSQIDESLLENYESWAETSPENDTDWEVKYRKRAYDEYAKRDEWREAVLQEGRGLVVFDW